MSNPFENNFVAPSPDIESEDQKPESNSRRNFLKYAGAAAAINAMPVLAYEEKENTPKTEKKETDAEVREKLQNFSNIINESFENGDIEYKEESFDVGENIKHIFNKLTDNPKLVDTQTYQLFAQLSHQERIIDGHSEFTRILDTISKRFAEKGGRFFNMANSEAGNEYSKPFIACTMRFRMTLNETGLSKLLPQEAIEKPYGIMYIDDEQFTSAGQLGYVGHTIVNLARVKRSYKTLHDFASTSNTETWSTYSENYFLNSVRDNELVHHILKNDLHFLQNAQDIDMEKFAQKQNIEKAPQRLADMNEFLSDAGSIAGDPRFFIFNMYNLNRQLSHGDINEGYGFTTNFTLSLVKEVMKRKGLENIKSQEIPSIFNEDDLQFVQSEFLRVGKAFVTEVEKISQDKEVSV